MPEEREIKIPVGDDFVLPDLDRSSRARARWTAARSSCRRRTGTPTDLTFLHAKLGLRHRSAPGKQGSGRSKPVRAWSATPSRARRPTSRGHPDQPPGTPSMRSARWSAMSRCTRSPSWSPTGTPSTSSQATRAAPRSRMTASRSASGIGPSRPFREVEVELFDADEQLIDAVMARLRSGRCGRARTARRSTFGRCAHSATMPDRTPSWLDPPALAAEGRGVARSTRAALPSGGTAPLGTIPLAGNPRPQGGPWASIVTTHQSRQS